MGARVFISYAGPDIQQAKLVAKGLTSLGHDVFFAPQNLRGGDQIAGTLDREIKTRDALVLIASHNIVAKPYIEAEVAAAFNYRKRIIVLRRTDYLGSDEIDFRTKSAVWVNCGARVGDRDVRTVSRGLEEIASSKKIVVASLNLKGGTGKTTLCGNIFAAISEVSPQPVLMIDLDPQHNLTQLLLRTTRAERAREADRAVLSLFEPSQISDPVSESPANTMEIRTEDTRSQTSWEALIEQPQLPAGPSVALVVGQFEAAKYALSRDGASIDRALGRFRDSVAQLNELFPIIAIDVNPSASAFTDAALSVATHIVAPVMPNVHSYSGVKLLCQLLKLRGRNDLVGRIIPVLTDFPSRLTVAESDLINAIRDDPDFGARTLAVGIDHSNYLKPRNDDPQGLGYLRNNRVGTNVRTVASLLLEELRKDALEEAAQRPDRHSGTG